MKLIKPSYEIWEQPAGLEGIYKQIEKAGRVCYKSEDKITEDSAKGFVDRMIKSGHGAMLEHGTVYLKVTNKGLSLDNYDKNQVENKYISNPYSKVIFGKYPKYNSYEEKLEATQEVYITTNYRVLVENGWLDDLQYICEPTEHHEKRVCVRYTSDIHFYKDCTRHRVFSWAIESTRFCNYIKQKFGSSVSFATPIWLKNEEQEEFEEDLKTIESIYFKWINKGWQPQQAAYFLIQGTKAEIIMTGFISDYEHFFDLRSEIAKTGQPHPTVVELVEPLRQEFIKRSYINN
mgnify:CR=1 FL=1|jgi:thymidylate synthase (FAD)